MRNSYNCKCYNYLNSITNGIECFKFHIETDKKTSYQKLLFALENYIVLLASVVLVTFYTSNIFKVFIYTGNIMSGLFLSIEIILNHTKILLKITAPKIYDSGITSNILLVILHCHFCNKKYSDNITLNKFIVVY